MSAAPPVPETLRNVIYDVVFERARQEALVAKGRFSCTCATPHKMTNDERLRVLVEEVGEVAKAIDTLAAGPWDPNPEPDCMTELEQVLSLVADLRAELVQVAAVAAAWIQGLDAEVAS